jgi:2,5-dihydroxypyridine 5,6-dioxygenase
MSRAMQEADFVVDVTTGGLLYSEEQSAILAAGTRILRVREPDDCLLRLLPSEAVKERTVRGRDRLAAARRLRLTSADGTDLTMDKANRPVPIQYGMADEPGRWDHWPTGMVNTTVIEESAEGRLVIGAASLLFPFERYVAEPIVIEFSGGVATSIEGGREAVMLSDMLDPRKHGHCRRIAHIGWGTDHRARWEVFANRGADGGGGAEARSLYGGILIALGENRDLGGANASSVHVDIALRRGQLELDGFAVAGDGSILDPGLA